MELFTLYSLPAAGERCFGNKTLLYIDITLWCEFPVPIIDTFISHLWVPREQAKIFTFTITGVSLVLNWCQHNIHNINTTVAGCRSLHLMTKLSHLTLQALRPPSRVCRDLKMVSNISTFFNQSPAESGQKRKWKNVSFVDKNCCYQISPWQMVSIQCRQHFKNTTQRR